MEQRAGTGFGIYSRWRRRQPGRSDRAVCAGSIRLFLNRAERAEAEHRWPGELAVVWVLLGTWVEIQSERAGRAGGCQRPPVDVAGVEARWTGNADRRDRP